MKHGPFGRHLEVASITQGVESGLIGHALCQAVAKHLARLDGDDDCQVQPVLAGRHAGEVIHPCPDARIDVKSPIEDFLGDRARMPTIVVRGTKRPLRTSCRPSSCISRRTCAGLIQCAELHHLPVPITPPALQEHLSQVRPKLCIRVPYRPPGNSFNRFT